MSAYNQLTVGTALVGGLQAKDDVNVGDDAVITDDLAAGSLKAGTGDKIDKILENAVSANPASIAANTRGAVAVTVSGAAVGDYIGFNPPSDLEAGLIYAGAYVSGANEATILLYNTTGGAIDGAARSWTYLLVSKEA